MGSANQQISRWKWSKTGRLRRPPRGRSRAIPAPQRGPCTETKWATTPLGVFRPLGACWVLRPPGPGRQRCRCSLRQVRSCHSTAPPPHSLARPGGRGDARGACRRRRAATQASRAAGPASVARLERPCADSSGIPLTSNIFTRELSDGFRWLCRGFRQLPIPLQRFPIASDSLASVSDSFRQLCERSDSFGSEQVRDSRSTDRLQPSAALPLTAHGQQLAAGRLQGLQRTEGSATGSSEAAQPARKQNRGPAVGRTPVLLIKTP